MPRVVDGPVPAEKPGMVGDDFPVAAHDDAVGIGADLNGTSHHPGRNGVAVAVEADEACAAYRMLALVEAVEGRDNRLEYSLFGCPCLGDRQFLLLGMLVHVGPAPTLGLQPAVQLRKAGKAQAWLEEAAARGLHLVLDLTLLPTRRGRAGGRLDHVVVGHDQEAPVEDTLLAGEHARHRGLHVVVDAARRHASEEGKRPRMRVEQHLLCLARIGPHIHGPRRAQSHMRDLHAHRLARDLHVLMAPVELIGLARSEQQRDERRRIHHIATSRLPPAGRITANRVVRAVEPFA